MARPPPYPTDRAEKANGLPRVCPGAKGHIWAPVSGANPLRRGGSSNPRAEVRTQTLRTPAGGAALPARGYRATRGEELGTLQYKPAPEDDNRRNISASDWARCAHHTHLRKRLRWYRDGPVSPPRARFWRIAQEAGPLPTCDLSLLSGVSGTANSGSIASSVVLTSRGCFASLDLGRGRVRRISQSVPVPLSS